MVSHLLDSFKWARVVAPADFLDYLILTDSRPLCGFLYAKNGKAENSFLTISTGPGRNQIGNPRPGHLTKSVDLLQYSYYTLVSGYGVTKSDSGRAVPYHFVPATYTLTV